ncbi:Hypothetical protein I595_1648 [Croceitalea dokdonensis DOKDO 023]|uniref:Dihydroorotase n=1 Tax=Croceitalea dokdonensis DOKDO 023 TaxID=1300341 RepID=A0A0P7A5V6_9FLAO|nr:hypothetical protein [Croceitalea dokdonensis]KPM32000.1 Hypothetical protein I595_1648 [Croceitalea dokdonensis DOKDO 023]
MMKYAIAFLFSISVLNAQDNVNVVPQDVEVGDVFEIGKPETNMYQHIKFPKPNFIIKKGGNANYKRVEGKKVVVTDVKERKDGTTRIKITPTDGGRFFETHSVVNADFLKALESGELMPL